MDIAAKLASIGITGNLYRLYSAAIEMGEAPIADIAAKAGLIRTTAYDAIGRLEQEGLVAVQIRRGKRYVVAQDPSVLLERLEGRRRMLDDLMPQLRSMYNRAKGKPKIQYYEGIEGIRTALRDTLTVTDEPKLIRGILSMEELLQTPGEAEMNRYIEQRIQRGIWLNVIRSEQKDTHPVWPSHPDFLRTLRYCPPNMVLSMTTFIYDQRVCLISSKKEDYALVIDSVEFATMQGTLFDAIWELSRPD